MDDENIIGYEFKGIKFYRESGRLESEFGISFIQSGDRHILFDLIRLKTVKKHEASEKTDIGITYVQLEQAISRIRRTLWDAGEKNTIIETLKNKDLKGYRFIAESAPIYNEPVPQPAPLPDGANTFESWLLNDGKKISFRLLICVILTFVASLILFMLAGKSIKFDLSKPVAALAQCFTIFYALYYAWKKYPVKKFPSTGNQQTNEKVTKSLTEIRKYWLGLFSSWFFLYLLLSVYFWESSFYPESARTAQAGTLGLAVNFLATISNYINTMLLVYCFANLNEQGEKDEESTKNMFGNLILILLISTLTILIISLIIYNQYPATIQNISTILDFSTGIVGGIAMALFIGRLQSKFLGMKPWLLILFYSYTAIQPLYFYLTLNRETIGIVLLINIYFVLKCLLYLYLAWIFDSTRLSFYLVEIREKHKDIESSWEKWLRDLKAIQNKSQPSDE